MRRVGALLATAGLVAGLVAFGAAPAGAGTAKGCSWEVDSLNRNRVAIDSARGPGRGATQDDPLQVDPEGFLAYSGNTNQVLQNGSWKASTSGAIAVSFGGKIRNRRGETQKEGVESLKERLTIDAGFLGRMDAFAGLVKIEYVGRGANGAQCVASGWIETTSSVLRSIPFYVGTLALLMGILLLLLGWPVGAAALAVETITGVDIEPTLEQTEGPGGPPSAGRPDLGG